MTGQLFFFFCLTFLKNVFSIHHISDRRRFNTFNEEKNLTQKVYDVLLDVLQRHEQLRVFEQEKRWR